ncbi:MAG: hypothetical protein ACLFPQ_00835 [Candidatus Woesearchaeota archaeon]
MSLSGFFLGSGMALLIALLGWGNQIKDFQTETKRLEVLLAKKLGARYADIKTASDKLDISNVQESFSDILGSVKKIIEKNKNKKNHYLKKINKLDKIERRYDNIKELYQRKYNFVIELTIICFSLGIISVIFENNLFNISYNVVPYFCSILPLIWIIRILFLLIKINKKEVLFQKNIVELDKDAED